MTTQTKPPMEFPQICTQVARLLNLHLERPACGYPNDERLDQLMDSLSGVEFILKLEEHFGIEIPDEETADIKTVEDVARAVERALLAQGSVADHPVLPDPASYVERRWVDRNAALLREGGDPPPVIQIHNDDPYHDLLTHHRLWRSYLKRAYSNITEEDSRKHLDHEIAALDRLVAFHRELVGKPEVEQVRELVEILKTVNPICNLTLAASAILSRYRLVPRKSI